MTPRPNCRRQTSSMRTRYVRALLDQLPQRQREVARLFYVDDRSVDDIARQLDVTSGTVKSYLAEARDRLRQAHPS